MDKVLMIGADVHDENVLTKFAVGQGAMAMRSFRNDRKGRQSMIRFFEDGAEGAGATRVVLAYEASGSGYGLRDELVAGGVECHVLAPSKIERSAKHRKAKTDEKDAERILELLRGFVLAGNRLPVVWVPDVETRDDREAVRARLDAVEKAAAVKVQVQMLLKRSGLEKPEGLGSNWMQGHRKWLARLAQEETYLRPGARAALDSLLRQLAALEAEMRRLDRELERLAADARHAPQMERLTALPGIGVLTALVFLTEMGNVLRFRNRRQIGAYVGLVPCSHESGEQADRKGHITRQGSSRLRKALCQATWSRIRYDARTRLLHERLVRRNPQKRKIAVVACMRQLAILLWHEAVRSAPPRAA
jgi:transposase